MDSRPGTFREFAYTPKFAGIDDTGSSLITLTVNLAQYRRNLRALQDYAAPSKLILVVKANAYGFGAAGLVPILEEFKDGASLGVANADEALELRTAGYSGRIILLGYTHPKNYYQIIHSGCELSAFRPEHIPELAQACRELDRPLKLHIKVDTGMTRLGVPPDELAGFIRKLGESPKISIVGLFTHLADSGQPDATVNARQVQQFARAIGIAETELGYRPECHAANSAALLNLPETHYDAVRIGILAYGILPPGNFRSEHMPELEPCCKLASEIIDLHEIPPGAGVSYSHTFIADKAMKVATLPLGYADGLFRSLSNRADVLIRGERCRLLGNITMDYVMADVTGLGAQIGDEAVFIGEQDGKTITVEEVAKLAGALPYEVTCALGRRVRREYVEI